MDADGLSESDRDAMRGSNAILTVFLTDRAYGRQRALRLWHELDGADAQLHTLLHLLTAALHMSVRAMRAGLPAVKPDDAATPGEHAALELMVLWAAPADEDDEKVMTDMQAIWERPGIYLSEREAIVLALLDYTLNVAHRLGFTGADRQAFAQEMGLLAAHNSIRDWR